MTEVRFGDFVLGIYLRMLFRHEFLVQNGGTAIVIGENIQCNSDRPSSKCITLFYRPWKVVNRNSPLQLPVTVGGALLCKMSISAMGTPCSQLCVPVFFPGGKAAQGVMLLTSNAKVKYEWSYTSTPVIRLRRLDRYLNIPPQIPLKKHSRCIGACIWLLIWRRTGASCLS
jgi:hypothetical protein